MGLHGAGNLAKGVAKATPDGGGIKTAQHADRDCGAERAHRRRTEEAQRCVRRKAQDGCNLDADGQGEQQSLTIDGAAFALCQRGGNHGAHHMGHGALVNAVELQAVHLPGVDERCGRWRHGKPVPEDAGGASMAPSER